ncbi:MAG: leucyl/phenylalanyl-tRNA--protein transferase [Actinomycetota bacterium]|nr:leucyl/phenylalanyl-tRNA--protein transferase [Actinomycetota bacterium]
MPIEPPAPRWVLPDVADLPAGQELVAVGADLSPGMLLAGYRSGLFAMPDGDLLGWWSPDPRGVLPARGVHVSRSLRRVLPRFEVSVDTAFDEVVAACADPRRPHGWISREYRSAYRTLHDLGWAHSIEVWDASGELAGGLFGVEVGGLFAGESKFHVSTDASKVAVVALGDLLGADGDPRRIIDVQWCTDHLATLGVVEVPRAAYLQALPAALSCRPVLSGATRPA